jgi:predicted ester cyclase
MELLHVWIDEVWHQGRLERVADCLGETYIRHDRGGNRVVTRNEYVEEIRAFRKSFPDVHFWLDDFAVSADGIWGRWRMTGTNAETGEKLNFSAFQSYRVQDGRLAETWMAAAPPGHDWSSPSDA